MTDAPTDLDHDSLAWIENFATVWESQRGKRMDGRVLALLIITQEPYLAASDIARVLAASTGAVSMSTRALADVGFITRHTLPGDRRHYYRAEDDVWGAFLKGERDYLRRLGAVLHSGLSLPPGRELGPRTRLRNGQLYMQWIEERHRRLAEDWRAYRDQLDPEDLA